MIGTGRTGDLGKPPHEELNTLWQDLDAMHNPADALLKAAAVEYLTNFAGVQATKIDLPVACEDETHPYVSVDAASAFIDLYENAFTPFITEWIDVAYSNNLLAPPRLLPQLLGFGQANEHTRPAVAGIAGNRGHWLATQLNKWPWLHTDKLQDLPDEIWYTGTPAERLTWLPVKLEADPGFAAQAIENIWASESPDTREAIVELVACYTHIAHETWLQQKALTDRRQSIRRLAIRALMKIPGSGFRKRSLQRAAELVKLNKNSLTQSTLSCEPPQKFIQEWTRDGLKEKSPSGSGHKDYWLLQILSIVPLKDWPVLTGHEKPMQLKINSDWAGSLEKAWRNAALIHPHAESLAPLLERLTSVSNIGVNMGIIISLLNIHPASVIADLLEPLRIPDGRRLELIRKTLPMLDSDKHKTTHQVASNWVFTDQHLAKNDAIALASCCDRKAIAMTLEKVSHAKELSSSAEEFIRGLECRQNYLKYFPQSVQPIS